MARDAWFTEALKIVTAMCLEKAAGDYFSVNDYRSKVTALAGEPLHHNHWGSLTRRCIGENLIAMTDECCTAKHKAAHGHKVRVYIVVRGKPQ